MPAGKWAVQLRQQMLFILGPVLDRLPRTRRIGQALATPFGKTSPPLTDARPAATQLLPDGIVAQALRGQKDDLGALGEGSDGLMPSAPAFQLRSLPVKVMSTAFRLMPESYINCAY